MGVGELLKSVGKRLLDAYILGPLVTLLVALLPPAALWTFAHDFVMAEHTVPGWAIAGASSLGGLLLVSVAFNVVLLWRRRRRVRPSHNLKLVAHAGLSGCRWSPGPAGSPSLALGTFDITNLSQTDLTVPRVMLEISRPWFRGGPHSYPGPLGLARVLRARNVLRAQHLQFDLPPGAVNGTFRGRVLLVDNFGVDNWGDWETWEQA